MTVDPGLRQTLFERVIADSTDAIVVVDVDDRVVLWNQGARRMFGYTADEMMGRLWSALVPPAGIERQTYRRVRQRALRDGHVNNVKVIRVAKDGRSVPVLLTRTMLRGEDGSVLGCAIVVKDLAQVEEVERRMARADKLAAIGQLVAHLAHEVRNPLNAVVLNHEMLRSALESRWPDAATGLAEHLDIMGNGLKVLERTVRDFLRLSRESPARSEPVDLAAVCRRVAQLMGREASRRAIRLLVAVPDDLPAVLGDQARIEHVLLNLLKNALEAVRRDGEVRLSARRRRGRVVVRVVDDGPGMDEDTRRRAFAPFFTTKASGTGLGLTIVERLVHELGGDVRCESAPGRGAAFSVVLPLAERGTAS